MSKLKPGWKRWRFDQMAKSVNDRVDDPSEAGVEFYVGLQHLDSDSLKIRRWGAPSDVSATKLLFEPGDIIFGRRRAYQRKLGVAEFRGIASAHSLVLRAKPEVVLPEFLPFFMQSDLFMELAQRISVGSLSPTINWKTLAKQEFALPPLEEQRRIVRVLRASMRTVVAARHLMESAEVTSMAVANHYIKIWLADGAAPMHTVLEGAPESGCSAPSVSASTGHYVLALSALSKAGYVEGELKVVVPTKKMIGALLKPGDLLISRSNTLERVGFVGRYRDENGRAVSFPDTMMRLHPKPKRYLSPALEMVLQSSAIRRSIMSIAAGTSASMKKINKQNLLQVLIPVPSLAQQRKAIGERKAVAAALRQARQRARYSWDVHLSILHDLLQTAE